VFEQGALGDVKRLELSVGASAEAVEPDVLVRCRGSKSEELSQLAGGLAPQYVHLEKPLLSMDETCGPHDVFETGSSNRGNSTFVSLDVDDPLQTSEDHGAVIAGNGRADVGAQPKTAYQPANARENQQAGQEPHRRPSA
jgi:hypothetical protein